jgi:hypothetical protein
VGIDDAFVMERVDRAQELSDLETTHIGDRSRCGRVDGGGHVR